MTNRTDQWMRLETRGSVRGADDVFHAALAEAQAEGLSTVQPETPSPRQGRGPLVGVAAMVGVLVVLGGSLLWASSLREPAGGDVADTVAPTEIERFPVPGYVPADVELVYGDYAVPDPSNPDSVDAVIVRATDGGFADGVVVTVYDSSLANIGIPEGEPVDLNSESATRIRGEDGVTLWWKHSSRVVSVRAPSGDTIVAEAIAASVRVADTGPFEPAVMSFGPLPEGFSVFAVPRLASRRAHPAVSMQSPIGPLSPEPQVATIAVLDDSLQQVAGSFGTATTVEIAGADGFLVEQDAGTVFMWSLSPTLTVTVGGTFPPGDIRAIAENLEFVNQADWHRHYDIAGPQLPTTTTTRAAPVSEPPAVGTNGNEPGAPSTTVP